MQYNHCKSANQIEKMTVHEKKKKYPEINYLMKNLVKNFTEQPDEYCELIDKRTKGNTCHTKLSLTALVEVSHQKYNNFFFFDLAK